ncbi:ATP-binding protein [Streptomyces jumonjinensis]|uniref:ATP-binding protein n=1 Tax=Streptomyces jumonjinensis TaxID=1945 RepID=A0A646KRU0_STRJU|nr:ATP-binding protein [Streptomyces jumonjinensis]MQT04820.1 ATP-binding protein [Streptomyces jumonjinensis]
MTKGLPPAANRSAALHSFTVGFAPAEYRVRQMRRITYANLCHWGLDDLTDAATLVVSELVTNAIQHAGGGPVSLSVEHHPCELLVEVTDGSQVVPVPRQAGDDDESGRGLFLIAAMAEAWGVSEDGGTKWCSLPLPTDNSRRSA